MKKFNGSSLNYIFHGKIGYVSINQGIGCRASKKFRLSSYSREKVKETVENNLNCLERILQFNQENGIFFFRISSNSVPFASHPVMDFPWQKHFKDHLHTIGGFIKDNGMRVSMHPDQFILLNSPRHGVLERSLKELIYHAEFMELLGLDESHKIQLHVGGVYGDKKESIKRFISRYRSLPASIKKRLVIENDDRSYSSRDCVFISRNTGVPVVFDVLHHQLNNNGETMVEALQPVLITWKKKDGLTLVDYSSQEPDKRPGAHAKTLDTSKFANFIYETQGMNFDIMLEIKDKEISALKATKIAGL